MNLDDIKRRNQELEILNLIALQLNKEVDLKNALSIVLKNSVELLKMRTGWIWLIHPSSNSVFLAASYQLPTAFTQHPERLSGWCYCIDKYLANHLEIPKNISEITCSRLKNLEEETNGLRFHATIPLVFEGEKIGILNMVGNESGKVSEQHLKLLASIGEMLSVAIQRARLFENSKKSGIEEERKRLSENMHNKIITNLKNLISKIDFEDTTALSELKTSLQNNIEIAENTFSDLMENTQAVSSSSEFEYPYTPLSARELEVLDLLKSGKTNKIIAGELFISERTVKFHVSSILGKLNAKNRTDAVQIAVRRGIIRIE